MELQLAVSLPLLMIRQFYHLPHPLPPLGSNSSCLFTWWPPLYASCHTTAVVESLSWVRFFVIPCTITRWAPPSSTISWSLLTFTPIESVVLSNHLIFCHPLLLLPSILPASGSLPMSRLFASGGQSIRAPASATVFPMNVQGWFLLQLTGLITLQSYYTVLLYFPRYCTIKLKVFFIFCVCFYLLFMWKYSKPTTEQYYIANCVSWVPRLTLLDLWINTTYKCALWMELIHM